MTAPRRWRFAMVCSSNMNRSMEAHAVLGRGARRRVLRHRLPGEAPRPVDARAQRLRLRHSYGGIYDDLRRKDPDLYKRNGLLPMLKRNISVKLAPQRWQDNTGDGVFDMILTFEERVFDLVVEDMNNREQRLLKSVLIINMDVKDNHEEAAVGAKLALDLCHKLEAVADDWEEIIDDLVAAFEKQHKRKLTYYISFY
ncbi:hypothetical protein ZWY2020_028602 [Hordeum vulgare]|nr:hypothetical protein ZWY2020_028602 [Hordeum vulgare]